MEKGNLNLRIVQATTGPDNKPAPVEVLIGHAHTPQQINVLPLSTKMLDLPSLLGIYRQRVSQGLWTSKLVHFTAIVAADSATIQCTNEQTNLKEEHEASLIVNPDFKLFGINTKSWHLSDLQKEMRKVGHLFKDKTEHARFVASLSKVNYKVENKVNSDMNTGDGNKKSEEEVVLQMSSELATSIWIELPVFVGRHQQKKQFELSIFREVINGKLTLMFENWELDSTIEEMLVQEIASFEKQIFQNLAIDADVNPSDDANANSAGKLVKSNPSFVYKFIRS